MRRRRDAGYTLMVSMMVIFALIGAGVAAAWLTSMGTSVSSNLNNRQAALNAATAGIHHARQILANYLNGVTPCVGHTKPWNCVMAGQGHAKDALPTMSKPGNVGAIVWDGVTPLVDVVYPGTPCSVETDCDATGGRCVAGRCNLGTYTVWVRNDPADINAALKKPSPDTEMLKEQGDTAGVVVRAQGRDSSGDAVVVLESAVIQFSKSTVAGPPNQTFGKNVDQFGSGTISGAVAF